jgi:hypothetical protein
MTKKRKRPRRSSALEGDEAEPLSPPLVDPTKPFKNASSANPSGKSNWKGCVRS